MKLKNHKKFPKEKKHIAILTEVDLLNEAITDNKALGSRTIKDWINYGRNQALAEVGELEFNLNVKKVTQKIFARICENGISLQLPSTFSTEQYCERLAQAIVEAFDKGELV